MKSMRRAAGLNLKSRLTQIASSKNRLIQNHRGNPQPAKVRFTRYSSLQLSRLRRALNLRLKDRVRI